MRRDFLDSLMCGSLLPVRDVEVRTQALEFVQEVLVAPVDQFDAGDAGRALGCQGGDKCLTHALWRDLSDRLTGFLNNITLGELVNNQEVLDVSGRQHTHDAPRTRIQDAIDVKLRA
mgnify:CR=1 FL=1